jgi:cytochrome b6-f complex iron-sulfur subunit
LKDPFEQVQHFVEALLEGRKPRRFRVESRDDADALRMAAALAAEGHPAAADPNPAFIKNLGIRLATPYQPASRRGFLAAVLAGLAAGLAGFSAGRLTVPSPEVPAAATTGGSGTLIRENGRWFPVARLSSLAERATMRFTAGALEGHLVKRGNEVAALSAICSHMPCSLVYRSADDDFLCPCHDATFHPTGEQKFARRPYAPLTKFEVKVEGDDVMVWSVGDDAPQAPFHNA